MRKILSICIAMLLIAGAAHGQMLVRSVASGPSYLLQEPFTGDNGTNLHGYNSWSGTDADNLEIQSNRGQLTTVGGSSHAVSKTFTEQDNVTFTYEVTVISGTANEACCGSSYSIIAVYDATNTQSLPQIKISEESDNQWTLEYTDNTGSDQTIQANLTVPFTFEIEVDLVNDTFSAWVEDSSVLTDIALRYTGQAPDTAVISTANSWPGSAPVIVIDDFNIYEGERQ